VPPSGVNGRGQLQPDHQPEPYNTGIKRVTQLKNHSQANAYQFQLMGLPMKFLRFFTNKVLDRKVQQPEAVPAITGEDFAELIKNPEKISSKMVRKIVLNGLMRLEKEGHDPFSMGEANPPTTKR
jgi:hypothetical protein